MDENRMHSEKKRKESNQEYAQMMLEHTEKKYGKTFEIIHEIFPEEGFNTNHLQSVVLLRQPQSNVITHVYATLGDPYTYYDAYVSDLASWENRHLVDCSKLDGVGTAKLYLYLREENANQPDVSEDNVSRAVLLVNIPQTPNVETLEKLYSIYEELFALKYEYIFLVAGFTEQSGEFDNYVRSYRVYGKKDWKDYNGKVYATLSAETAGLTFEAFQQLCRYE